MINLHHNYFLCIKINYIYIKTYLKEINIFNKLLKNNLDDSKTSANGSYNHSSRFTHFKNNFEYISDEDDNEDDDNDVLDKLKHD